MKAAVILGSTGILLSGAISPAMAEQVGSAVAGGDLKATTAVATLAGVTLDGYNQDVTGVSTEWTITDARGTGVKWALSASATNLTSAAGSFDTTPRTIAVGNLSITPGTVTAEPGSDASTNIAAPLLQLSTSEQPLVSTPGESKGSYTLTPTFSLTIPANAYRSNYAAAIGSTLLNPYISTITFTIA